MNASTGAHVRNRVAKAKMLLKHPAPEAEDDRVGVLSGAAGLALECTCMCDRCRRRIQRAREIAMETESEDDTEVMAAYTRSSIRQEKGK